MEQTNYTAVIILNYNNWQDTINCIESVEKYNRAPIKYIVIDNGSTNKEAVHELDNYLSARFKGDYAKTIECSSIDTTLCKCTFVVSEYNDGYARGNNKGLKYAYKDNEISHVLILNNDILFVEDIIPQLEHSLEALPNAAIVCPCLYKKGMTAMDFTCARKNYTNWELILTYFFMYKDLFGIISSMANKRSILKHEPRLKKSDVVEIELPSGSCMLIKKEVMKNIEGFDPSTFLFFEENILYKKICRIGGKNYILPKLKCIHLGGSTTAKSSSAFILSADCNSAEYYLRHYADLTVLQRLLLPIAIGMMKLKIKVIKLVKG